jgi:hypothetical protein
MPLSTTCSRAIVSAKAAFSVMGKGFEGDRISEAFPACANDLSLPRFGHEPKSTAAGVHRRRDYCSKGLVTESEMQTPEQQAFKCA